MDPDANLGQLDGKIYLKIKDYLDIQPNVLSSFISNLDGVFTMRARDVERPGLSSPTEALFSYLRMKNMSIQQFADYVALTGDVKLMGLLQMPVPITVISCPPRKVHLTEGESLSLVMTASGYPAPTYQWFKNEQILPGQNKGTYYVRAASGADKGVYQCVAYHPDDQSNSNTRSSFPCEVYVYAAAPIKIKRHPKQCWVDFGGNAVFVCDVVDQVGISYQWYKDDCSLEDSEHVKGSHSRELILLNLESTDWLGSYSCQVSKGSRSERSQGAPLLFRNDLALWEPLTEYTATDKVALLIGNNDYRGDSLLTAPPFDVQTLATAFQTLGFKVMSLLNLTKNEMLAAVYEFRQLVGEGVYCVFYFCGHGFEISNQCYLVPIDAPHGYDHTHCIKADHIFRELLIREPRMCCMILDICRQHLQDFSSKPNFEPNYNGYTRGNSIVCFATCRGLAAYEDKIKKDGILVSHLKEFLHHPISVEQVFTRLREKLGKDQRVNNNGHRQIADVITNLTEPRRSFTNKIVTNGFTAQRDERREFWEQANRKPEQRELSVQFPGFEVQVLLSFEQEFSNVLTVYVTVADPGLGEHCVAYVNAVSMEVAEKGDVNWVNGRSDTGVRTTYVSIKNIQRLKESLEMNIAVRCFVEGQELMAKSEEIDLELPLVACLHLWRERPVKRDPVAEEEDETPGTSLPYSK